jgi:hypothetical protein
MPVYLQGAPFFVILCGVLSFIATVRKKMLVLFLRLFVSILALHMPVSPAILQ